MPLFIIGNHPKILKPALQPVPPVVYFNLIDFFFGTEIDLQPRLGFIIGMTDRLFTKRAIGVSIDCTIRGSIPELTALARLGRQSQVFTRMINFHLGQVQNSLWRIVGHTYKPGSYWSAPGGQGLGLLIYFKIPIRLMPEPGNTILKLLDFRFVFFRR